MSKIKLQGHQSGSGIFTLTSANSNTDRTITLPDASATIATTIDVAARLPSITDGGNATAITIDSAENVGIGITPKTWYSTHTALQIAPTGALYNSSNWQDFNIACNAYYDSGGTESYIQTDAACKIRLTDSGLMDFKVAASGSADAAITWTTPLTIALAGDVTVGTGDIVFGTAGKGIVLGATTNVAANTLDDYEIGQGSVVVKLGGTTLTVSGAGYKYTKIGDLVTFQFEFRITNLNGASEGSFEVALPFTTIAGTYAAGVIRIYQGAVAGDEFIGIDPNANQLYIARRVNNSATANVTATNNAYYYGSLTYRT
jgi:hypothetical protein|tara:strand:- start:2045 stop:2992 length:948 start_codon:yes stop_codon:yes gene_type:complete